jgi:PAS domain S-box-containing protein
MSDARRARILMVDDRPENLLALEALLEPLGHTLVRANSGAEALRALLKDDYAVILLDVQMPEMNGFECAELIKTRERSKFTPIIFLTALNKEDQHVFQGYSVGAVDYMSKPLQPEILRSKVSVFVELFLKNEELRDKERALQEAERHALEARHDLEMSATEARFEEILASANDAILTFSDDLKVRLFNRAAETLFGYDADAAHGMDILKLFGPDSREDIQFEIQSMVTSSPEEGRTMQVTGVRANGSDMPIEISLSRQRTSSASEYTLIGRDMRDRVAAEAALRQSADELRLLNTELSRRQQDLEHAIGARSRFYASMSHELRTPINAILGYSSLLLDNIYGPLNDQQVSSLERTNRAAKHLLELVNDILDLSKMEAGKIELAVEPVTFPGVIEELFATVRPLADEHGSELSLQHGGEPITIVSDPRRVRQILLNLFSNAIKFGDGKPIGVRCIPTESGGIRIGVQDEGPGIAKDDTERIFDEFVQLAQNPEKLKEGTGLGLSISQRLAELLGGSLGVDSEPGVGSTFWLTLPKDYDHVSTGGVAPSEVGVGV